MRTVNEELIRGWMPSREGDQDTTNRDYGQVLLIGGSAGMGGSIIMSAEAAVQSGAGLTTVATDVEHHVALHTRVPEAMALPLHDLTGISEQVKKSTVIAIGPGLGLHERAVNVFRLVLASIREDQLLILDADALTLLAREKSKLRTPKVILTPHAGEWQRITDLEPEKQTDERNQEWAEQLHATVVLKGDRTRIYTEQEFFLNIQGSSAMATGGMGDCLTGIIAGLCAQSRDKVEGLVSAVYIHSLIGRDLGEHQHVVRPVQIAELLPTYIKRISSQS
ncbi:NAD(P)H-hydrate dehydratase [Alkalihalobacillus sp. FSL W8-0930]